ncbi:MAG: hypothetical protein ABTD50_00475 [Polyangiaceae bacterium]
MKIKALLLLGATSVIACGSPASENGETTGDVSQEVVGGGITATISNASASGGTYSAKVTVVNNSPDPMSSWQVELTPGTVTISTANTSGAESYMIGGYAWFAPNRNASVLAANGGSTSFLFSGKYSGSTYTAPTVYLVDGHANGNAGAEWPNDGVDHQARAAGTAALNLAIAYENNKLPNNGDSNYALYDSLLWSSQMFVIDTSVNEIEFDPNAPGYAFIPTAAFNALEAAQDNSKEVAAYLVAGLQSCFADTNGAEFYEFKAAALKNFVLGTKSSGTVPGWTPPSGSNTTNPLDSYTVTDTSMGSGATKILMTLTSSNDYWFSAVAYNNMSLFPGASKVTSKFTGGQVAGCSPFNGPGGTSNPHLLITLNGQSINAWVQNPAQQCNNPGCTSVLTIDPDDYASAGPQTNAHGLEGPQVNPFVYDTSNPLCTPDHYGQWGCYYNASNQYICGMFTTPYSRRGVVAGYLWQQCGTSGAGC